MDRKQLHAAADFGDDILHARHFYDREQLDDLMAFVASLGVTRLEWIYHCWMALDETYPGGFNLQAEAVRAAHRHGMEFVAVIKPFEVLHDVFPHPFPDLSAQGLSWRSLRGHFHEAPGIALRRPDLCFQRRPGGPAPSGPVTAIRLVKRDDKPSGLQAEDLSVWTGDQNGIWAPLGQPFRLTQSVAWRNLFPKAGSCRILTLDGFSIPEDQRYVEVRCARPDPAGEFVNDQDSIVELAGADGRTFPATPPALFSLHGRWLEFAAGAVSSRLFRYAAAPEVRACLGREDELRRWAADMRDYSHRGYPSVPYAFDRIGRVSVVRGVDERVPIPHPIYPEVRTYWLEVVRRFIDQGADGIDFRHCMHLRVGDMHEYGFNEPVLERTGGSCNTAEVARVTGEAYTQLLREAAALAHGRGRLFGVHLSAELLGRADENRVEPFVRNLDFQWQTWLREFADFAVFRGAMGNRAESIRRIIDRFGLACREAGRPLIYQSNRRYYTSAGPYPYHDWELSWVLQHPDVAAYQLYETASFTRLDEAGRLAGSPAIADLVRRHGFGRGEEARAHG